MVSFNTYFDRGDGVRIVAVFSQQQFSKFIIQVSHLRLGAGKGNDEETNDWLKGKKGQRRRRSRRRSVALRQEPVRSKRLWPPAPPAGARAHPTGPEVCCRTSVRRHPEFWLSTAASDWLSSPPRPKSFCHCRQESAEHSDSHTCHK